ncbi:MAG: S53 family peptidase [Acidilobus sp.]
MSFLAPALRPARATSQQANYYGPSLQGTYLGQVPSTKIISVSVFLPPRNLQELYLLAQEVANHQIPPLSRQKVLELFAPSEQELQAVEDYLSSQGFSIIYVSPDRLSVMAAAPASVVEGIFGTKLGLYEAPDGTVFYAPEGTPVIPAPLQGTVVVGLTNRTAFRPQFIVAGELKGHQIVPFNLTGLSIPLLNRLSEVVPEQQAFAGLYYTPADFEGAYNVTPIMGYSQGASIAIIDAYGDPEIYQDVYTFDQIFGLPIVNLTIIPIGPYHPSLGVMTGWDIETALDVEAAQTMAPYAHIYLVVAANNGNALLEAIDYVVSTDLADVVSMSWGLPENLWATSGAYTSFPAFYLNYAFADYYFALGSAEGISFFASSGDEGAFDLTPTTYGAVLFPSSSPFVTAVGGTTLYVNVTSGYLGFLDTTGSYLTETAWSVSPLYGIEVASTGGYSSFFPKPWYQSGVVQGNYRTTPDVSADANPYTGFVEILYGIPVVIGGTSLASPLWAGIAADIDGYVGMKLGLLNPLLYEVYKSPSLYAKAFHQVTFGYNGYYLAGPGYNLVTGLGSPNAGELAQAIYDILSTSKTLSISVTTYQPGAQFAWYMYNTSFEVEAYITFPNGTVTTSGSFYAYIFTTGGLLEEVPLTYNSTSGEWQASVYVESGTPPNVWTILVNGTSGPYSGAGATDAYIGVGITIVEPIPYPYAPPIPVDFPFAIAAYAMFPNGTAAPTQSLEVVFYRNRMPVFTATLLPTSTAGLYEGKSMLMYPEPQGAYIMYVYYLGPNGKVEGSAYEYVYFGEAVLAGYVITPLNDGMPSVSPNQTLIFLAYVMNPWGLGMFTSQVWVDIYNLSGYLVAQVPLQPAPYPLLGYQIGFFTVPPDMPHGWYDAVFVTAENTSTGPLFGYLNQSFYVAPRAAQSPLVVVPSFVFENQWIELQAYILYPNGTPVTSGEFVATLLPTQDLPSLPSYSYYIGVPLQYDVALGAWVGYVQVPSIISPSIFSGEGVYSLAGPWNVVVAGVSPTGINLYPSTWPTYVEPYTYMDPTTVTSSNISSLSSSIRSGNVLYNVYFPSLKIIGTDVTIVNSVVGQLSVINSTITVINSNVSTLSAANSRVTLRGGVVEGGTVGIQALNSNIAVEGTEFADLKYAFSVVGGSLSVQSASYVNVGSIAAPGVEGNSVQQALESIASQAISELSALPRGPFNVRSPVLQVPATPSPENPGLGASQGSGAVISTPSTTSASMPLIGVLLSLAAVTIAGVALDLFRLRRVSP